MMSATHGAHGAPTATEPQVTPPALFAPARWLLARQFEVTAWFLGLVLVFMFGIFPPLLNRSQGALEFSLWEMFAGNGPAWFLFGMGVMHATYLPILVAQGLTRRRFAEAAALALVIGAAALAAATAVGYGLEALLHDGPGFERQRLGQHLFEQPAQVHLVMLEYTLRYLLFGLAGLLTGCSYYRFGGWWGTAALPLTVGVPIIVGASLLGAGNWGLAQAGLVVTPAGALLMALCLPLLFLACRALLRGTPIRSSGP